MAKIKEAIEAVPEFPKVVETFDKPSAYHANLIPVDGAYLGVNGQVNVKRYKITIEEIEEPVVLIQARLQHLWEHSDNMHHMRPLSELAAKYNYTFSGSWGSKRKR